jgi:hypothetical protein
MERLLLLGFVLLALLGCEPAQPPASDGSGAPATTNPYAEFSTSASDVFSNMQTLKLPQRSIARSLEWG